MIAHHQKLHYAITPTFSSLKIGAHPLLHFQQFGSWCRAIFTPSALAMVQSINCSLFLMGREGLCCDRLHLQHNNINLSQLNTLCCYCTAHHHKTMTSKPAEDVVNDGKEATNSDLERQARADTLVVELPKSLGAGVSTALEYNTLQ